MEKTICIKLTVGNKTYDLKKLAAQRHHSVEFVANRIIRSYLKSLGAKKHE